VLPQYKFLVKNWKLNLHTNGIKNSKMKNMNIRKIVKSLLVGTGVLLSVSLQAQDGFEKYHREQQKAFAQYAQKEQEAFKSYRDSLNREFAVFLEKTWQTYPLTKPKPPIDKPIPEPPVYDPTAPRPEPQKVPVVTPQPAPPEPAPTPPAPKPTPAPEEDKYPVKTSFFGTPVSLKAIAQPAAHLTGVSEKEVAAYWLALSQMPYLDWTSEAMRIKTALLLNDWGLYQLLKKLFDVYIPNGARNEQTVFVVFMLNELGYRAQIGRSGNELLSLIAFSDMVYNTMYFTFGKSEGRYSVINPSHKELSSVQSCAINYPEAATKGNMNLLLQTTPRLAVHKQSKALKSEKEAYTMEYNKNMVDFYTTYPLTAFNLYADAPIEAIAKSSIEKLIEPHIKNKSQEEAVNWRLHFVQMKFVYKTDDEQFGYEKWNFAEETIASDYSDCDDRAILFAQLVRRLLGMPVVLIYYPGVHLATAVQFDNSATSGDYIMIEGKKYLICDPTYINANLGMAMPDLRNVAVEIKKVK
jgi:hypothetical protein